MNTPVTNKELDAFYGVPPTDFERQEVIARHTHAYDADDLQADAFEHANEICAALANGDNGVAGITLALARLATIERRADAELYGVDRTNKGCQNESAN